MHVHNDFTDRNNNKPRTSMQINSNFCELCRAKYRLAEDCPPPEDQKAEELFCDYCTIPGQPRHEAVSLYLGTSHRTIVSR